MTEMTPQDATLIFLQELESKAFIINVKTKDGFACFRINRDQLLNLNAVTAELLMKAFK